MRSVVDRNVVMQRIPVITATQIEEATERAKDSPLITYVRFVDDCKLNEVVFFRIQTTTTNTA
jgi:hypothetical protein